MNEQAYLFVHFKEKDTPDGEQVYFGISRDGFHWEPINNGNPVLWAYYGNKGVRDFTIIRCNHTGKFYIFATDLSISYGRHRQNPEFWENISRNGSKYFSVWESENLTDWSEQKLIQIGNDQFGCLWAPDIIYDNNQKNYLLHWSSSHKNDDYRRKRIYYCRTKDFENFTQPELLYEKEDSGVIDSAMYEDHGMYYLFVKSDANPTNNIMLQSPQITGPFERIDAFDQSMAHLDGTYYEAPTAIHLADGRWCLFLDYYGVRGAGQGYVPFVTKDLSSGKFMRSDDSFSFPYRFKHGTILEINLDEYERLKKHDWNL